MSHGKYALLSICLLLGAMLAGCADPAELSALGEDEIRTVRSDELCEAYHYGGADNVRNEINRRQLISEARWNRVDANKLTTGMSECAVLASLGSPDSIEAKTASDRSKIFVFERGDMILRVHYSKDRVSKIERIES